MKQRIDELERTIEQFLEQKTITSDMITFEDVKELTRSIYSNSLEAKLEELEKLVGFNSLFWNRKEIGYTVLYNKNLTNFQVTGNTPLEAVNKALEKIRDEKPPMSDGIHEWG